MTITLLPDLPSRTLQALLRCHDEVTNQTLQTPHSVTEDDEREYLYERASQYGDEIKIVRLQKTADPLVHFFVSFDISYDYVLIMLIILETYTSITYTSIEVYFTIFTIKQ